MTTRKYKVRPDFYPRVDADTTYSPGEVLTLTPEEAGKFLHMLELLPEKPPKKEEPPK